MVSPYNRGGKKEGGHAHSRGSGEINFILPLDAEGGYNVASEFRKNMIAAPKGRQNHVRPGWSPGYNR